jgi:hypothetical protein
MSKRRFRPGRTKARPDYPTLELFDRGRREFLQRLGGTLLGAGALAAGLAACGDRAVTEGPDSGQPLAGEPPQPDAEIDGIVPQPDVEGPTMGVAPLPPSKKDAGPEWPVDGEPPPPDARLDQEFWAGGKPGPPSQGDGGSCPNP